MIAPIPYLRHYSRLCISEFANGMAVVSAMRFPCGGSGVYIPTAEEKLSASVRASKSRVRRTIREKSYANPFEFWATFTFLPEMQDGAIGKRPLTPAGFAKSARNHCGYRKRKLSYVMVVVPNADNEHWHIHALLRGLPEDELVLLTAETPGITENQKRRLQNGATLYKWTEFDKLYHSHHELVKLGTLDTYGEIISQEGKTVYMARQFDNADDESYRRFPYRRIMASRDLKKGEKKVLFLADADMVELMSRAGAPIGTFGACCILSPEAAEGFMETLHRDYHSFSEAEWTGRFLR